MSHLRLPQSDHFRTQFEEKFPPDREPGKELDDNARVWKVYRAQAIDHDDALLRRWNETVNLLLTFAGLFSAAVTSFVVASTDDLKPDPNAYVANVLFAMLNATSGDSSSFSSIPSPPSLDAAAPSLLSRAANGLWYTSLFIALAAALLCILVKQWLDEYVARTRSPAKNPRQWVQRRHFYFQGFADWHVALIISFLPVLLHVALFSFLTGLTAFLWDLDKSIAGVLLGLVVLLFSFYVWCLVLPLGAAACPYATPLLHQLLVLLDLVAFSLSESQRWLQGRVLGLKLRWRPSFMSSVLRNTNVNADPESRIASTAATNTVLSGQVQDDGTSSRSIRQRRLRQTRDGMLETGSASGTLTEFDTKSRISRAASDIRMSVRQLRRQHSRPPFNRLLETNARGAYDLTFDARMECDALAWLIRDVPDGDALAVGWQSLGILLSEPTSPRAAYMAEHIFALYGGGKGRDQFLEEFREMHHDEFVLDMLDMNLPIFSFIHGEVLPPGPPRSKSGDMQLLSDIWLAMRTNGEMDDPQLARISRSWLWILNLFVSSRRLRRCSLRDLPDSALRYYEVTQSPDAALLYANLQNNMNLLVQRPWTWWTTSPTITVVATGLAFAYAPHSDWIVPLLCCSDMHQVSATMWNYAAKGRTDQCVEGHYNCDRVCMANALARRIPSDAIVDVEEWNNIPIGAEYLNTFPPVQLVARIVASLHIHRRVTSSSERLAPSVWNALTDSRIWSSMTEVDSEPWSESLACHIRTSTASRLYEWHGLESLIETWRVLVCSAAQTHRLIAGVYLHTAHSNVAFQKVSVSNLTECWGSLCRLVAEQKDVTAQLGALRSLLTLLDAAVIAVASIEPQNVQERLLERLCAFPNTWVMFRRYLVVCLESPEEERDSWAKLFARIMQHTVAHCPGFWTEFRAAALESGDAGAISFFLNIKDMVIESGPCEEGSCSGRGQRDWPTELT